jgi:hypothetical protein
LLPRVVDIGPAPVAVLRAHRRARAAMALLAAADALVFADEEGRHLHPERFSRTFGEALARCRRELAAAGQEPPPMIRLHDLRHTHATLLQRRARARRVPPSRALLGRSHHDRLRPRPARQSAQGRRSVRRDARRGPGMNTVTANCGRCDRQFDPSDADAGQWNAVLSRGVATGALCPDCQSPEENAEAEVNAATLRYGQDGLGRVRGWPK